MMQLFIFLVFYLRFSRANSINDAPIIGILSQQTSKELNEQFPGFDSYIAASYVKFIESGGARAVPIW